MDDEDGKNKSYYLYIDSSYKLFSTMSFDYYNRSSNIIVGNNGNLGGDGSTGIECGVQF